MARFILSVIFVLACTASSVYAGNQDRNSSPDGIWQKIDGAGLQQRQAQRPIIPNAFLTFSLNMDALNRLLRRAPMEFTEAARNSQVIFTLPMPDGTFAKFRIEESPVIEAGLAAKFPGLKTYRAQGIDDPTATMRFDVTPLGFHAIVLSTHETVYVDPYAKGDTRNYIAYKKSDLSSEGRVWECGFVDPADGLIEEGSLRPETTEVTNGSTLRTYRLALAATGEYTAFFGGTVPGALAAQVVTMNRINAVYEKEVAIHMNIIANNNLIIYTNSSTDPYSNSDGFAMLDQNQINIDAVIGNANYDIGHVFSTGGGGVAALGSVCNAISKARGVTGSPSPVGDGYDIDYVAHEMGHQFGARHTFNGTSSNCGGGNRSAGAAVEPGSGITIMAYAGICGAQDLAAHSIDTFSVRSLEEIVGFREAAGSCGPATATGNTPPSPTGPGDFTIPKGTPFALIASATDVNGDSLTYSWEERDFGPASPPDTDADGMARPLFRPYLPLVGGTRNFPSLTYILNNANVPPATVGGFLTGEILPSIARTMNFQVVVRDNRANGGGINTAASALTISSATGPFAITAPNTAVSWAGGSSQTVSWNVNGTNGAPVNAANVKISLSTDGGNTFPTTINASTPNDGSEIITVPNIPTVGARIRVEAVGNIFFDISDANFTITPGVSGQPAVLDFDGDNKTDYVVARDTGGALTWYLQRSTAGFLGQAWGTAATDQLVPGDYDGDGKWDLAVWRPGSPANFYILQSATSTFLAVPFGQTGDDPRITQDFDGDHKADPAVTRNVGGTTTWYIQRSALGFTYALFGNATTDLAIRGDFDGDGKADVAVYRTGAGIPANTFFVMRSSDGGIQSQPFGVFTTDNIVPADFDGDGKTDYAVWRGASAGSSGTWYWLQSSDGGFRALTFGVGGLDRPVPGDFDGDGKTDQAVWRPGAPSTFYVNRSTAGFVGFAFGISGDSLPGYSLQVR